MPVFLTYMQVFFDLHFNTAILLIPYYMIMRAQPLIRDSSCAMRAIWNYNKTTLAKAFSQNNFLHNQVVGMSVDSNIRVVALSPS